MLIKVKISVVFDYSSQYIGTSINRNLFSGPDLTNHLFCILNRFSLGTGSTYSQHTSNVLPSKGTRKAEIVLRILMVE